VVAAWMVLAALGVIPDPYPFLFLLFLSSLAQLVLMFVIMVGQDVLGAASDRRDVETADHTTVVLQQCRHLRQHLVAQDEVIADLVARAETSGAPVPQAHEDHSALSSGPR
jgi:hypothetical protein